MGLKIKVKINKKKE